MTRPNGHWADDERLGSNYGLRVNNDPESHDDPLSAARGILTAVIIGLMIYAVALFILWWVMT